MKKLKKLGTDRRFISDVRKWGRKLHEIGTSHSPFKGGYLNINTEGMDASLVYDGNYQRLQKVKAKFDPGM